MFLFRRTDRYGYSRYNGGGGPAWILRIIVTLAVIFGLIVGVVSFAFKRYVVYTENGGHFEFPWSKGNSVDDNNNPNDNLTGDLTIVVDTADTSASSSTSTVPEQTAQEVVLEDTNSESSSQADTITEDNANIITDNSTDSTEKQGIFAAICNFFKNLFGGNKNDTSDAASGDTSTDMANNVVPDESAVSSGDVSVPVEEPQVVLPEGQKIQHVAINDLLNGVEMDTASESNADGIMVVLKEGFGTVNFTSKEDLAVEHEVNVSESKAETIESAIQEITSSDYYSVAYVDCFQDETLGAVSDLKLYDGGGSPWYDDDKRCWTDPANEEVQDYLIGLMKEIEKMGFDEIVLNNACYPSNGDTSILSSECYNPDTFSSTVDAFYSKIAEEFKDSNMLISVVSSSDVITDGESTLTGQTLENIKKLGGRIWINSDDIDNIGDLNSTLESNDYPANSLGILTESFEDISEKNCQMIEE